MSHVHMPESNKTYSNKVILISKYVFCGTLSILENHKIFTPLKIPTIWCNLCTLRFQYHEIIMSCQLYIHMYSSAYVCGPTDPGLMLVHIVTLRSHIDQMITLIASYVVGR